MGKGDWRRPTQISRDEETKKWDEAFGPRPERHLNVMSEEDRAEMEAEKLRLARELETPNEGNS